MQSATNPRGESDYVALEPDEPRRRSGVGSQPLIVGLMILALVLVVGLLATTVHSNNSGRAAFNPTPAEIAPEAPWDGKQSHRLPIAVTPATGLTSNQIVTVTGSGFPRGKQVAAVVCTIDAGRKGVDACDINTASSLAGTQTTVAADGTFTIQYKVHRHIIVGGRPIDCATGNVDTAAYHQAVVEFGPLVRITTPGAFSCLIAVGAIDNYDQSGGFLVSFAGEKFRPFDVDGTPETTTTTLPTIPNGTTPTTTAAGSTPSELPAPPSTSTNPSTRATTSTTVLG